MTLSDAEMIVAPSHTADAETIFSQILTNYKSPKIFSIFGNYNILKILLIFTNTMAQKSN